MDVGTSMAVCVGIATVGGVILSFLRFFKNKNGGTDSKGLNDKGFVSLEGILRKEFVTEKTCEANIKGIETSIRLTKEALMGKIGDLDRTFDTGLKNLRREMSKTKGP